MQKQNDIFSYFTNPKVDIRSLLKSNDISSDVQKHLVKVYTTLCMTFAASMLGVFLDSMLHLGGLLTSLASFGVLISIRMVSIEKYALRMNMLMAYGALLGMSTGSLVKLAWHVDKSIIITALLSSGAMFGCFTCSALFGKSHKILRILMNYKLRSKTPIHAVFGRHFVVCANGDDGNVFGEHVFPKSMGCFDEIGTCILVFALNHKGVDIVHGAVCVCRICGVRYTSYH